jgi:hypothetical protein
MHAVRQVLRQPADPWRYFRRADGYSVSRTGSQCRMNGGKGVWGETNVWICQPSGPHGLPLARPLPNLRVRTEEGRATADRVRQIRDAVVRQLRDRLSPGDRQSLLRDARYSVDWIFEVVKRIAAN